MCSTFHYQLWYAHRPPDEDQGRSRAYSQSDVQDSQSPETMKLNVGISSNGDVEVGEISLTEMDPEDIRVNYENYDEKDKILTLSIKALLNLGIVS